MMTGTLGWTYKRVVVKANEDQKLLITWNLRHWNLNQSFQDPQRAWRERLWAPSWSYHWEDKIECKDVLYFSKSWFHLSVSKWGLGSLRSSLRGPSLKSPSPSLRWSSRVASESREESSLPCASRRALAIGNVIMMDEVEDWTWGLVKISKSTC